jgi:hypothetical protein
MSDIKYYTALQDGDLISGSVQDCTPIADQPKAMHNEGFHGSSDMRLAARIPLVVVEHYLAKNGIVYDEFAASQEHKRRLIMDPDNAHFRIWAGRL